MISPRRGPHPKHDRWMVSYADFITLLFALFVVMYAVAQEGRGTAKDVSESVRRALSDGHSWSKQAQPHAPPLAAAESQPLLAPFEKLRTQLAGEIASGKMQASLEERGIVVSLREKGFFSSGKDQIHEDGFASLEKVALVIRDLPNAVRLEGHTDSVPIHNERFRSNWDLSAARGIAVLSWFASHYAIPPQRFSIAGSADNDPVAGNDSEEGRAQNRRVDIVILNQK